MDPPPAEGSTYWDLAENLGGRSVRERLIGTTHDHGVPVRLTGSSGLTRVRPPL